MYSYIREHIQYNEEEVANIEKHDAPFKQGADSHKVLMHPREHI